MDDYQIIFVTYYCEHKNFERVCEEKNLLITLVEPKEELNEDRIFFYKAKLPDNLLKYWNDKDIDDEDFNNKSFDNLYALEEICDINRSLSRIKIESERLHISSYIIHLDSEKRKQIAIGAKENWWYIYHTDIDIIREFYGEYNAYYIAWLQHLTKWLFYLSIFSLVGVIWQISIARTDTFFSSVYSFVVPIWSTLMLNKWDLFNHKRNYIWNHHNFEISETLRPEFYSDDQKEIEYLGNKIKIKEKQNTILTYFQTYSIYSFFLGLIVANAYLSHYLKNILPDTYGELVSCGVSTIIMFVIESIFKRTIKRLNDIENHATDTEYNDGLVIKNVIFNFINTFFNLYYSIIYEPNISISIYLFFQYFFKEILIRHFKDFVFSFCANSQQNIEHETEYEKLYNEYLESDEEIDTIQEHSELVILFSYMTIFACFFPGACLLFLVNNHYEMIKDLRTFEKSKLVLPKKSGGIGLWKDIYRYTLYLSIISNSYFLLFFSNSFPKFGGFPKIVLIIAFEHFIIGLGIIINFFWPTVPNKLKVLLKNDYQEKQSKKNQKKLDSYKDTLV